MSQKRTVQWVPGCFKQAAVPAEGDKPAVEEKVLYDGHLIVEVPLSEDRCEVLIELGIKAVKDEQGAGEEDQTGQSSKEALDVYRRFAKKLIVGAEVTRVSDQKKLTLEEVLSEPYLLMLPVQMGWKYISGFGAGNE